MKTLKIFILLTFILGFASKVNAQTVVSKEAASNVTFWIDCVNEKATGNITAHLMLHFDKNGNLIRWQQMISGEFTGETTETVYSLKGIWQDNLQLETSGGVLTDNSQIIYRLVGQSGPNKGLNIRFHGLWHLVIDRNGDIQVVLWKPTLKCE